ncbi:MAG: hypothetical protein Kow0069_28420 [Promethearchaeota archaeon]
MPRDERLRVHVVPHQHYDVAWYLPTSTCGRVAADNLLDALKLMRRSAEFTFVVDQAALVEAFREHHPEAFPELVRRVRQGRVGLAGAMLAMPDSLLPSGEALVRNLVLGKKYFWEEFGVDVVDGWMLDAFGQSSQLPQLFAKARVRSTTFFRGFDYRRPHVLDFRWAAPDGSEVLAHVFPATKMNVGYTTFLAPTTALAVLFCAAERARAPLYATVFDVHSRRPFELLRAYASLRRQVAKRLKRASVGSDVLLLVGSDFCRPNPALPAVVKAIGRLVSRASGGLTSVYFSTPRAYFDAVENSRDALPVVAGEFVAAPYVLHGTYSTRALTKKLTRRLEHRLYEAEAFCSLASLLLGAPYPHEVFDGAWRVALENDFHDVICGCCSDVVYLESTRRLKEAIQVTGEELERALGQLSSSLEVGDGGRAGEGGRVVVFNPLPWEVREVTRVRLPPAALPGGVALRVLDPGGNARPASRTRDGVEFPCEVGGLGWTTLRVVAAEDGVEGAGTGSALVSVDRTTGRTTLENEHYRVVVERDGRWVELTKNGADGPGPNLVAPGVGWFGRVLVHREAGDAYFTVVKNYEPLRPKRVDVRSGGSEAGTSAWVEVVETFERRCRRSVVRTKVTLKAGVDRVDVSVRVNNQFKRVVYRLGFPANLRPHSARVTRGVPAGFAEGPPGRLAAVRWLAMKGRTATPPERELQVDFLDRGVPAREVRGNVAYFTLLRSVGVLGKVLDVPFPAAFPYRTKGAYERGPHSFDVALVVREGAHHPPATTARAAWQFNSPPVARVRPAIGTFPSPSTDKLPAQFRAWWFQDDHHVVLAFKPGYPSVVAARSVGSDYHVIRALEQGGEETGRPLRLAVSPRLGRLEVVETNLLEEPVEPPVSLEPGEESEWSCRPQEVKSLGLRFL